MAYDYLPLFHVFSNLNDFFKVSFHYARETLDETLGEVLFVRVRHSRKKCLTLFRKSRFIRCSVWFNGFCG